MIIVSVLLGTLLSAGPDSGLVLVGEPVHLRQTDPREWSSFSEQPEARALEVRFEVTDPDAYRTLRWFQEDVRRYWRISLNGTQIGALLDDEAPQLRLTPVPPGALRTGTNRLEISTAAEEADDVFVGRLELLPRTVEALLDESRLRVQVVDGRGEPLPARVTVADANGALVPLRAEGPAHVAVRTGVVYTATGEASLSLPAGEYQIYASRGSAYEVDSAAVTLRPSADEAVRLVVRRSVEPAGYVGLDTHVHTLTWSGHGDATVSERVLTVVGEGLDGVVLTEHNLNATLHDTAAAMGVTDAHFIAGNEYTTPRGHFNFFPVDPAESSPGHEVSSWDEIAEGVRGAPLVILNHGRDLHAGFAPLGPERFLQISGERLDGATLPANAMEVWNSSAQRSDAFELFRDWLALVNRGSILVPVGSSDSHDVSRYLLGQGRTWVRCAACTGGDAEGQIVEAIAAGQVAASMGLVVEIMTDGRPADGALLTVGDSVLVEARVWGPSWLPAEEVRFYVNGSEARTDRVETPSAGGVKHTARWRMPRPAHDVSLVALASGPAPQRPFWSIPWPYQRTSDEADRVVAGTSGLVRIDADGDGRWTSPYGYAQRTLDAHRDDLGGAMKALAGFDRAVMIQAASILRARGIEANSPEYHALLDEAGEAVREAIEAYHTAAGGGQMNSSTER